METFILWVFFFILLVIMSFHNLSFILDLPFEINFWKLNIISLLVYIFKAKNIAKFTFYQWVKNRKYCYFLFDAITQLLLINFHILYIVYVIITCLKIIVRYKHIRCLPVNISLIGQLNCCILTFKYRHTCRFLSN